MQSHESTLELQSMNSLAVVDVETGEVVRSANGGDLANFEPQEALTNDAKSDAIIDLAKRTKDWPLLERAVEKKLDDQEDFVNWWSENVRGPGKSNSRRTGRIGADEAEGLTGINHRQVSKWAKRLAKRDEYRGALYGVAYRQAMGALLNNFRAQASGKQEWYTPAEYIEAAREVMGGIDLDPATSEYAQETVKAAEFFTAERNGLNQPWRGRVWLNPPYAAQQVQAFVGKLVAEYKAQRVWQAVLLVNNCTDTGWFHEAALEASAICFTAGRISFVNPDGDSTSPTQGQAFFYFGSDTPAFIERFGQFGLVVTRA